MSSPRIETKRKSKGLCDEKFGTLHRVFKSRWRLFVPVPCQSQREAKPRPTAIFSRPERRPWAVILVICVVATDLSRIVSTIVDSIVMYVDDER